MQRIKQRTDLIENINPNQLADEFDPAIISLFQYEGVNGVSEVEGDFNSFGQSHDIFSAYLYAKEHVLPFIRKNGISAIQPNQLMEWLKQAHRRIAHTLAQFSGFTAGTYTTQQVLRWNWGGQAHDIVGCIVGGIDEGIKYLRILADQNEISEKLQDKVIALLIKIRNIEELKYVDALGQQYASRTGKPLDAVNMVGRTKLLDAYNNKLLSAEEDKTLKELVIVCMNPEKYPAAMDQFANDLLNQWKACNAKDDEQLTELLLTAYKGVAGIHPFANGNGRLATWLMNVIARSLNKPSFLMRHPGDKAIATSSYSIAIKEIDTNPALFKKHVLARIHEAENLPRVEYKVENELVVVRCHTYAMMFKLLKKITMAELVKLNDEVLTKVSVMLTAKYEKSRLGQDPIVLLDACKFQESFYAKKLNELSNNKGSTLFAKPVLTPPIAEIKQILMDLSGEKAWQDYSKGTVMLLTLGENDLEKSRAIVAILSKIEGIKVEAKLNPKTNQRVVKVSEIDVGKLRVGWAELAKPNNVTRN